jgi:hypothetical protein
MESGVYFGLPEEQYHAAFALSSSSIKHLRVTGLDFWSRSALNPNLEDVQEDEADSEAKILGTAYHTRIVSGKQAFAATFAPEIDVKDFPNALRTVEELKAELRQRGLKLTGTKSVLVETLLADDPTIQVWDLIQYDYEARHAGKWFLPQKYLSKIEIAAAMIEKHPTLCKAFSGGAPEVSVFWIDRTHGVPCKARLDYLKPSAIVDLKSFGNVQNKPLDIAIPREIASRKYHVQGAMYDEGASHIADFIKQERVFGSADPGLVAGLARNLPKTWLWVFQMKGPAPVARGITLPREGMLFRIGQAEVENAKQAFRANWEKYGSDPWVDDTPITALDDAAVPPWAIE